MQFVLKIFRPCYFAVEKHKSESQYKNCRIFNDEVNIHLNSEESGLKWFLQMCNLG